jgi:hypothetical protein
MLLERAIFFRVISFSPLLHMRPFANVCRLHCCGQS